MEQALDARGNRTSVTDALAHQTTFTYNNMSRLTRITHPDTTHTDFAYDNRGRRTSVTDANAKVTSYAYDDADRLVTVTDAQTPTHGVTQYAYDTENNPLSITDASGRVTSFTYDPLGHVTQTAFPSSLVETYTYDAVGNLTAMTDRKGQAINYTYDDLDRLTHKGYPDSTGVDYTYDLAGRLTNVSDPTGTYEFSYDNLSRLLSVLHRNGGGAVIDGASYTVDAVGNRSSKTNQLNGITDNYGYDAIYQLLQVTQGATTTESYSYDLVENRLSSLGVSPYSYNNSNQLTSWLIQQKGVGS